MELLKISKEPKAIRKAIKFAALFLQLAPFCLVRWFAIFDG